MNKKDFSTLFFSKTRDFLDKYEAQQLRRSENTIESYRDGLTSFRRFITNEKKKSMLTFTFSDCTNELVLDYMEYLQNRGYAKTTCNHRLSALHAYLWYASDCDVKVLPVALAVSHLPFLRESEVVRRDQQRMHGRFTRCSREFQENSDPGYHDHGNSV